uniref:39S ribosomal protein L28, mitochondrial n=1 Tax=Meloidogyne incognita TaxID=6306 RepID=A0A914MED8_MELIC
MIPTKSCSLTKNLIPLTDKAPRAVLIWNMHEKIRRNKEIWDDPDSIVHRLPKHYQRRYWKNFVLSKPAPVHYTPPEFRYYWDNKRNVQLETEEYPILPLRCPEQDQGLWGGEGVIKGYRESNPKLKKKILPRLWIPKLWTPTIKSALLYSEILDIYMNINVTDRVKRLIDQHFGLDLYLLETPDVDIDSRLGIDLKRQLLLALASKNYYHNDSVRQEYITNKYSRFVIPLEEAEWYGLDLNTACRKLQDIEDNKEPIPLKKLFSEKLISEIKKGVKSEVVPLEEAEEEEEGLTYEKHKWVGWRI